MTVTSPKTMSVDDIAKALNGVGTVEKAAVKTRHSKEIACEFCGVKYKTSGIKFHTVTCSMNPESTGIANAVMCDGCGILFDRRSLKTHQNQTCNGNAVDSLFRIWRSQRVRLNVVGKDWQNWSMDDEIKRREFDISTLRAGELKRLNDLVLNDEYTPKPMSARIAAAERAKQKKLEKANAEKLAAFEAKSQPKAIAIAAAKLAKQEAIAEAKATESLVEVEYPSIIDMAEAGILGIEDPGLTKAEVEEFIWKMRSHCQILNDDFLDWTILTVGMFNQK